MADAAGSLDAESALSASLVGGNRIALLQGGDELFPAMIAAIADARHEVWLATYIFHDDGAARGVADALGAAARRGVSVRVVVDGFGTHGTLVRLRQWLAEPGIQLEVFRPLERWWSWFIPGQLRRMHQKLCVVDYACAFVGGINIIDDRNDLNHGRTALPRWDFAVALQGPLVRSVRASAQAIWTRAQLGHLWRDEVLALAASRRPVSEARRLIRRLRGRRPRQVPVNASRPVVAALLVRDNVSRRRTIERAYVQAIRGARRRVDIAVPYFYPGRAFRRSLRHAAQRGVQVRLLLQGKVDYRIAALAARALYAELRGHGVRIFEYTPAFLHAKVAVVDDDWATVGSSNIDPLSLLLNLEANVVVRDRGFTAELGQRFEAAFAVSTEVAGAPQRAGWRGRLERTVVAWLAAAYLRVAGITGRY
ncbi:MAG TPA: cardiolipin synthase ClsB [Rubrivivax sp.]|nr:cardiolipin synthase ClsB [Burkholderiales bacterium]HNT38614.1 cardiolipin synthase ClsB [Rubrivivax sp.]